MTIAQDPTRPDAMSVAVPALSIDTVTKAFSGITAVDHVSLTVEPGAFLGLLGPNGAGKTTLISMISGLVPSDSGSCEILGADTRTDAARARRLLGVVPQDLAIYPELSAYENLAFFGAMYGLRGKGLGVRIEDALDRVGLLDRVRKPAVGTFSGGQKRRLNIAAALLHRPRVLILDEPTVGVDPQSRNHIFETLRELNAEGTTIIYVTHYMEEVEALCREVAIIDHGTVIERGLLSDVLAAHGSSVVRLLLSETERAEAIALLSQRPGISWREDGRRLEITSSALQSAIDALTAILTKVAPRPQECQILPPSLETVFIALTGNRLRDQ